MPGPHSSNNLQLLNRSAWRGMYVWRRKGRKEAAGCYRRRPLSVIPKFLENSVRLTNLTIYIYGTGEEGSVGSGHQQRDREL